MLTARRRLLAASLTGALALTGAGLVLPSAAAPAQAAAACHEVHAAAVLRKAVRSTVALELRTYTRLVPVSDLAVETATQTNATVLADTASTQQQKDIALADLQSAKDVDEIVATAVHDAKAAKAALPTCGLGAMRHLRTRVIRIARTMAANSGRAAVTQYRVHLRADTETRDSYAGGDASQYAHWSKVVESDQAILDSLHDAIAALKR